MPRRLLHGNRRRSLVILPRCLLQLGLRLTRVPARLLEICHRLRIVWALCKLWSGRRSGNPLRTCSLRLALLLRPLLRCA
jgi:hypothetical protein